AAFGTFNVQGNAFKFAQSRLFGDDGAIAGAAFGDLDDTSAAALQQALNVTLFGDNGDVSGAAFGTFNAVGNTFKFTQPKLFGEGGDLASAAFGDMDDTAVSALQHV